jgi:hypothetical protein
MKQLFLAAVSLVTLFSGFTSNANAWVVVYHYRVVYHRAIIIHRPPPPPPHWHP